MSLPRSVAPIVAVSIIVVLAVFSTPLLIDGMATQEETQTTTVDIKGVGTADIGGAPLTVEVIETSPVQIRVTDTVTGEQVITGISESETINMSDSFQGGDLTITYEQRDGNVRTFSVEHSQPWDFDEGAFEEHSDEISTVFMVVVIVTTVVIAARVFTR